MKWLDNVALRDLAFHKNYAACVDARGDVYQWGEKVTSLQNQMPRLAMKGKDIKEIRLTDNKLYALSTTGRVYALSLVSSEEGLHQSDSTSASNSWWGASWFGGKGESIEFIEVIPKQKLSWGERITSIVAGDNHLLAVTSKGRTFAHPINKHANSCGQLGIRKVEVHNDLRDGKQESLVVDLTPRSLVDPFVMAALANRRGRPSEESDKAPKLNDKSIHSCPYLFEIPALQGVFVEQVAAGRRSSFARTSTGRVLAWGANEYGQLGLGKEIPFETVTVPTEVILWRFTPATMQTKCLDVSAGGDLTSFTVERSKGSQASSVDLLMCGNGQWGGLGNNTYSTAQGTPVKAKSVSGLSEYDDDTRSLRPIQLHSIAISPSGHVMAILETSKNVGGRDLVVWGRNLAGELGNGRRSSVATPTTMEGVDGRVMLRRRKGEVRDMGGGVWGQGVAVEQRAAAGDGTSAIYWRILTH
ncbi:hypothetical protein AX15_004995 [Amanita polypyramis BW_CC]|nr:hypothetical protein AX15_004995 [Amanita polypyramis BW_CC]